MGYGRIKIFDYYGLVRNKFTTGVIKKKIAEPRERGFYSVLPKYEVFNTYLIK